MRKILVRVSKILVGFIAVMIVLLLSVAALLNTDRVQNKLLQFSVSVLSDKLETKVEADSISLSFLKQHLSLWGVSIEDKEHRKMFEMDELTLSAKLLPLLRNEVRLELVKVSGLRAALYKPSPEEPANYQFVLDAFKSDKRAKKSDETKKKKKLTFDVSLVKLERVDVKYNDSEASLELLEYKKTLLGKQAGRLTGLKAKWVAKTKKGPQDCEAGIANMTYQSKDDKHLVAIGGLHFANDNHLPRKNVGKPKHGAFDAGHVNAVANLNLTATLLGKDTLRATLDRCDAVDKDAGIVVKDITLALAANKELINLSNVVISLENTVLRFDSGMLRLPSKKRGVKLAYHTSEIKGDVLLKDIAKPFAPVLAKFSLPLVLTAKMKGDDDAMSFNDILVSTKDKKLTISAKGGITELKDKYKLDVSFHVNKMHARKGIVPHVINQFPVKKFMMKQVDNLGDIYYTGDFSILWKKEKFSGVLTTAVGKLNFNLTLDENTKYLNGAVSTKEVDLGTAFDMGNMRCWDTKASFTFDYSKPRTAKMRKLKGGKLPIGSVNAEIGSAKYKLLKVNNVVSHIESDGAVAVGNINIKGKRTDILCSFSFTNTDSIKNKIKIKPGIRFHGLSDDEKTAKDEAKAKKRQEKELQKQQAADEKARKKAQKAQEKAAKNALKAEEKARKKEEKAARKAEKKAAKEAAKAAKAAAKNQ